MDVNEIDSRVGQKVVLTREFPPGLGFPFYSAGTIKSKCRAHGFWKEGAWSLYGGRGWQREFVFLFLPERERKRVTVYLSHVLRIEEVA